MKTSTNDKSAFTLVEVMIVVSIVGLLASISIPTMMKARDISQRNACISNLKQIDGAKSTWALEQKKANSDVPPNTDLFGANNYLRDEPVCPATGGTYPMVRVDIKQTCPTTTTLGHTL